MYVALRLKTSSVHCLNAWNRLRRKAVVVVITSCWWVKTIVPFPYTRLSTVLCRKKPALVLNMAWVLKTQITLSSGKRSLETSLTERRLSLTRSSRVEKVRKRILSKLSQATILPAQPFLRLLDFGVLEKDCAWIQQDLCWPCAACC